MIPAYPWDRQQSQIQGDRDSMCLGIPMKVVKIKDGFAEVETGRLLRAVNIQMLSGIRQGDYVIVHAGFAIQKVDPEKARDSLKIIDEETFKIL